MFNFDVEIEAAWLFIIGVVCTYVLEIGISIFLLKENARWRQTKNILIQYNVSSMISSYLMIILFRRGRTPILSIQMNCNGILALYGITWAISVFAFVRLIELLNEKK